jgi:hypothetical protein
LLVFSGDAKFFAFPLEVGKTWNLSYSVVGKVKLHTTRWQLNAATVAAHEKVKVPAGEFDAFRIEYRGFWNNDTTARNGRAIIKNWYAPAARSVVRREIDDTFNVTALELVEFQLAVACW